MSNQNDGGSAFPRALPDITVKPDEALELIKRYSGMTLRDYFAAKAMQGILAGDHPITHDPDPLPTVAATAYKLADAMLAARGQS